MKKVLVGGVFDVFHYGHLCLLKWAKKKGNYLIVQVIGDERVQFKKGSNRPIFPEKERLAVIRAIKYVDEAFLSRRPVSTNPTLGAIKRVKPDIYIRNRKGNENSLAKEKALCKKLGVKIIYHNDFPKGKNKIHTTKIVEGSML